MKTVGAYVVVIYSGTPYVLVHKRSKRIRHGGKICAPGGSIDRHERAVDAAVRELKEESGLVVSASSARVLGTTGTHTNYMWVYKTFPALGRPSVFEVDPWDIDIPGGFVVSRHCWAPLQALIHVLERRPMLRYPPSFTEFKVLAQYFTKLT